ncbi:hypothetical protein [Pseudomonas sp. 58(2021)]|uniref:hypothetical protein n=1 Tax=Pseudomonas sp. 58(2021) TaxID=2813330 RepID=UPI001A9FE2E9|nr:hypothetical protein [Pseudomonas sp. 58(2021)]
MQASTTEETCYCCDKPSEGREHVPPRCLFPKGEDAGLADLITVPSCAEHNPDQSHIDEQLMQMLVGTSADVHPEVLQRTVRGIIRHVKKDSQIIGRFGIEKVAPKQYIQHPTGPVNFEVIEQALEKIAKGVYHHHTKEEQKLDSVLAVHPLFLGIDESATPEAREKILDLIALAHCDFEEFPSHGLNPQYFAYQIIDYPGHVFINLKFYDQKIASVVCRLPNQ